METILIVDDDAGFRSLMETILRGESYEVDSAASVEEAIACANRRSYRLLISDLKLPDGTGLDLLRHWKQEMPEVPVIMITGFGTIATAVEAMKLGAADYLSKPLSSPDELRIVVRKALEQNRAVRECDLLREQESARFSCGDLIASDLKMAKALELVRKVAPTQAAVLITGESGTGNHGDMKRLPIVEENTKFPMFIMRRSLGGARTHRSSGGGLARSAARFGSPRESFLQHNQVTSDWRKAGPRDPLAGVISNPRASRDSGSAGEDYSGASRAIWRLPRSCRRPVQWP